jgi:hypothetical protein
MGAAAAMLVAQQALQTTLTAAGSYRELSYRQDQLKAEEQYRQELLRQRHRRAENELDDILGAQAASFSGRGVSAFEGSAGAIRADTIDQAYQSMRDDAVATSYEVAALRTARHAVGDQIAMLPLQSVLNFATLSSPAIPLYGSPTGTGTTGRDAGTGAYGQPTQAGVAVWGRRERLPGRV